MAAARIRVRDFVPVLRRIVARRSLGRASRSEGLLCLQSETFLGIFHGVASVQSDELGDCRSGTWKCRAISPSILASDFGKFCRGVVESRGDVRAQDLDTGDYPYRKDPLSAFLFRPDAAGRVNSPNLALTWRGIRFESGSRAWGFR